VSATRLTLRSAPSVPLEAPSVRPDAFAALTEAQIERLPAWHGKDEVRLGDFFDVQGTGRDEVRVLGDVGRVKHLGAGMTGGRLVVEGRAGMHAGAGMRGGHLRIEGDADHWTGAEMHGGVLEVLGNAGDELGGAYAGSATGMTGGVALVHGSVGRHVGDRLRRGLIAVAGDAKPCAGAHGVAGTLLVCGDLARGAGVGLKRATIVAGGAVEPPSTFRYACSYRPGFLSLLFRSLEARGFPVPERFATGLFRRYGGDNADLGRGEILQWVTE
jgi:formylmethanofuran dehydrogenase subunit C